MEKCFYCYYKVKGWNEHLTCQHKPNMEGTEAISEYVKCENVSSCDYIIEKD